MAALGIKMTRVVDLQNQNVGYDHEYLVRRLMWDQLSVKLSKMSHVV